MRFQIVNAISHQSAVIKQWSMPGLSLQYDSFVVFEPT